MSYLVLLTITALILGLIIGSFIAARSYRVIHDIPVENWGRSMCPHCNKILKWFHLVPVVSYFVLRKKCAFCKVPIKAFYARIEIITAITFAITTLLFHVFVSPLSVFSPLSLLALGHILLVTSCLLYVSITDLAIKELTVGGVMFITIITLLLSLIFDLPVTFSDSILGLIVLTTFFVLLTYIGKKIWLTDVLGEGDLYLSALLGTVLGLQGSIICIYLAIILGGVTSIFVVMRKKKKGVTIPFVPFLSIGGYLSFFFAEAIFTWYLSLFSL